MWEGVVEAVYHRGGLLPIFDEVSHSTNITLVPLNHAFCSVASRLYAVNFFPRTRYRYGKEVEGGTEQERGGEA